MKADWGTIAWEKRDKYIIKNYKNMTYKTMARNLGLKYSTLCSRVLLLRDEGKIEKKMKAEAKKKTAKKTNRNKRVKKKTVELETGKKYRVKNWTPKGEDFMGVLVGETDKFYIFRSAAGYLICYLKVDFRIGEYIAEKVGEIK